MRIQSINQLISIDKDTSEAGPRQHRPRAPNIEKQLQLQHSQSQGVDKDPCCGKNPRSRGDNTVHYEKACADAHSSNYDAPSCAPVTWGYTFNKGQDGTIVLQTVARGRIQEPLLHWGDKFTQSDDDIRYSCTPSLLEILISTLESSGPKLPALPR